MKIIENNPDRLALYNFPTLQIFLGILFGVIGLITTFFFARSIDIHCEKAAAGQASCRMSDKLLGYISLGSRTVQNVQQAEVTESRDSDGDVTYRVVFRTSSGNQPLTYFSSSGYQGKANLAQEINAYLQSNRQDALDLKMVMEWWTVLFLVAFGGAGAVMVLLAKTDRIEMVRSQGVLRIAKRGLFGLREEEHLLREIESVVLESSSSSRGGKTYRIAFHTADGGARLLSRMYSSGWRDKQKAVDAMNQFLADYHPKK